MLVKGGVPYASFIQWLRLTSVSESAELQCKLIISESKLVNSYATPNQNKNQTIHSMPTTRYKHTIHASMHVFAVLMEEDETATHKLPFLTAYFTTAHANDACTCHLHDTHNRTVQVSVNAQQYQCMLSS